MAYIETIGEDEASGELSGLYRKYGDGDGRVDDVLKLHSLNPASLEAHCRLYGQACHRAGPVPLVMREMIGVVVSRLNGCGYCLAHHTRGLEGLLDVDRKGVGELLAAGDEGGLTEVEKVVMGFVAKLTVEPGAMGALDVEGLRGVGLGDREVLDVVQVAGYFAYANRVVLGLGGELEERS